MKNIIKHLLVISFITLSLPGCMSAASMAITGAQAVYDRHNIQKNLNNHYIVLKSYRTIYLDTDHYKNTNVTVSAFNNVVLLTGQTPNAKQKHEIEELVRPIAGRKQLYNLITIAQPTSPLIRASDTWITTKIKTRLIATNEIDPNLIKVITENGTVYLLGIVPPNQAKIAVNIARTTHGVQSVIKIFSYIKITKTA